jgi:hypothetical protein
MAVIVSDERAADVEMLIPDVTFARRQSVSSLGTLRRHGREQPSPFVLNRDGSLLGLFEVPRGREGSTSVTSSSDLSEQFGVDLVLELRPEQQRRVALWYRGSHLADFAMIERIGAWLLRDFRGGADQIVTRQPGFDSEIVEEALRRCIATSYEHGCSLVLRPSTEAAHQRWSSVGGEPVERPLDKLDGDAFAGLAGEDGALVVSSEGIVKVYKATLPTDDRGFSEPYRSRTQTTLRRLQESVRGKRHLSALLASAFDPECIVFCASENGTVCVFVAGDAVLWDF